LSTLHSSSDARDECLTVFYSDVADQHPETQIIGVDLSPIQPEFIPGNCTFELDDCTEPWTWPDSHFDLIHIRALLGSIADWPQLYREVYE